MVGAWAGANSRYDLAPFVSWSNLPSADRASLHHPEGSNDVANDTLVTLLHRYFPFGFQTSRDGWVRFEVGSLLAHDVPFSDENCRYTVRRLADLYNRRPPTPGRPVATLHAEQWLCLGLLNDALRYVLLHYFLQEQPGALDDAFAWARHRLGGGPHRPPAPGVRQHVPPRRRAAGRARAVHLAGHGRAGDHRPRPCDRRGRAALYHDAQPRHPAVPRPVRRRRPGPPRQLRTLRGEPGRVLRDPGAGRLQRSDPVPHPARAHPGQPRGSGRPAGLHPRALGTPAARRHAVAPGPGQRPAQRGLGRAGPRVRPAAGAGIRHRALAGGRARRFQPRRRLDEQRGPDGQEHLRVAGPALAPPRSPDHHPGPDSRRGTGPAGALGASPACGSSGCGNGRRPRARSSSSAAIPMPWPRPTACAITTSPPIWAARPPTRICATAPGSEASAWPATWCPTTWASTRAGSSSIPTGSCRATVPPTPPTSSPAATCATTPTWKCASRRATGPAPTPPWSSNATTCEAASADTSTTATTAPACPGTTRPSWTSPRPRCEKPSSRPSCTWLASSPSSASTRP